MRSLIVVAFMLTMIGCGRKTTTIIGEQGPQGEIGQVGPDGQDGTSGERGKTGEDFNHPEEYDDNMFCDITLANDTYDYGVLGRTPKRVKDNYFTYTKLNGVVIKTGQENNGNKKLRVKYDVDTNMITVTETFQDQDEDNVNVWSRYCDES